MKIALHDSDKDFLKKKSFPNLALMRISSFHKGRDDSVCWWQREEEYDLVYSSKIFDFTPRNLDLPEDTLRGGTGYRDLPLNQTLAQEIEVCKPDYSIYPDCDFALGYLTRGCIRSCRWCVVPSKEGNIHSYRRWQEVVREDSKKLTLLDNNILACDYGLEQLEELASTDFKLDLNQGMDARLVSPEVAELLSRLKWQRFLRFSCDTMSQVENIFKVAHLLGLHGVKPYRIFVYLLVTADVENASQRVEALKKLKGINIFAQAERNESLGITPNKEQRTFVNRFMFGRCYKKGTWEEYLERTNTVFLNGDEENGRYVNRLLSEKR